MNVGDRHNLRENLLLALDTLRTHKFRSLLTVLGVLIGTLTVILVASIIVGLDAQMNQAINQFGARNMYIYKFEPGFHFRLTREERMRKPLASEDADAIRAQCPDVEAVGVEIWQWGPSPPMKYKDHEMLNANFGGATPEDLRIVNAPLADGRLFNEIDDLHRRDVVILGADVVTQFFVNEDPIGKTVNIDGNPFEVIGTLGKRKEFLGDSGNDRVAMVPYHTYKKIYPGAKENFIIAQALPGRLSQATDEVRGVLRRLRRVKPSDPDNFGIATADSIITQFHQITGTIALVMVVLSSIGLLVGGIGVMNIMLVSVTERTREIGVRKAIGARRTDITWQFLLEAMTLTGMGGVLGIATGWFCSLLIRTAFPDFPTSVPAWSVVLGLGVSISVGLFFGMWPALKAARLDPIVALRYE